MLMLKMILMMMLNASKAWQVENYYDEEISPSVPGQLQRITCVQVHNLIQ